MLIGLYLGFVPPCSFQIVCCRSTSIVGIWGHTTKLFDGMPLRDVVSWNAMISGYASSDDMVGASWCFEMMPTRDVVSWNSMLSGFLHAGESLESVKVFIEMGRSGVEFDNKTFAVIPKVCFLLEDYKLRMQIHGIAVQMGYDSDVVSGYLTLQGQRVRDKLSNPTSQLKAYGFDVIRASIPKLNLDDVFEQKKVIARSIEEKLDKAMTAYGYQILQTLVTDIEPAARLRVAANEKAEAEKIIQIKRAEGEAESKYLSGLGIARQRQAIVDGLRDSVLGFAGNVPGLDMVLMTQYFDTMKEIGASSKSSSVFVPHGTGAVADVAQQIRDGFMHAQAFSSTSR